MELHYLFAFSLHHNNVNKYCKGEKKISMPGETRNAA
jgi:hypothetical protein